VYVFIKNCKTHCLAANSFAHEAISVLHIIIFNYSMELTIPTICQNDDAFTLFLRHFANILWVNNPTSFFGTSSIVSIKQRRFRSWLFSVYKSYSQSLSAIETLKFRLRAYLAEDQWSPEIWNILFVTKLRQLKKSPPPKKIVNESYPFFSTTLPLIMTLKISIIKIIINWLNTLLRQYTIIFHITVSQTYSCSVQNIT